MSSTSEELYNRGNAAMRADDYPSAVALYDESLTLDPGFDLAYYNRGLCRLRLEDAEGLTDLIIAARLGCIFKPLYDAIARHGCQWIGFAATDDFLEDQEIAEENRNLIRASLVGHLPQAHYLFASEAIVAGELDDDSLRDYCRLADGASLVCATLPQIDRLDSLVKALDFASERGDGEVLWRAWYLLGVKAYYPCVYDQPAEHLPVDVPEVCMPVAWSEDEVAQAFLELGTQFELNLDSEDQKNSLARIARHCFEQAGTVLCDLPTGPPETWSRMTTTEAEKEWFLCEDVFREWARCCVYLGDAEGLCDAIESARFRYHALAARTVDLPLERQLEALGRLFGPLQEEQSVLRPGSGDLVVDLYVGEIVEDRLLTAVLSEGEAIAVEEEITVRPRSGDEEQDSILTRLLRANETWMPQTARQTLSSEALAAFEAGGSAGAARNALFRASFEELPNRVDPELDALLLGPAHAAIVRCRRLAIVPFSYLHNFPYHALPTIADRVESGDIEAVAYAPSLRTMAALTQNAEARGERATCLFVGCDIGNTLSIEREMEVVESSFAEVEALVGRKASLSAVLDALPSFGVVHFCCHGSFDLDAMVPYLQLADGRLFPHNVLSLEGVPGLVFANTCISAVGTRTSRNGDQRIGLHTSFLLAGAGGVIGTLWKAHDGVAVDLAADFYATWTGNSEAPGATVLTACQRRLRSHYPELGQWAVHAFFGPLG